MDFQLGPVPGFLVCPVRYVRGPGDLTADAEPGPGRTPLLPVYFGLSPPVIRSFAATGLAAKVARFGLW